jgi:hypothetical protein
VVNFEQILFANGRTLYDAFRRAKNEGETVMIDTLAMAFVALALGLPAVIGATMLGSKL